MKENNYPILKGIFTSSEWIFIADALNGQIMDEPFRSELGVFIATCEDAERYEGAATRHEVDLNAFINKAQQLNPTMLEALLTRVEKFWEHSHETDLWEWANALASDYSPRIAIGRQVAVLRNKRGLSTRQLAEMCGVTYVNINKIENGRYNVSIDILHRVCEALNCDIKLIEKVEATE